MIPGIAELVLSGVIASTSVTSSATASGGSSASASSKVTIDGSSSVVEIRTNVDGVEHVERRENKDGGSISVSVVATSSKGDATSVSSSTGTTTLSDSERKSVERVLDLFRSVLAYFGIKI